MPVGDFLKLILIQRLTILFTNHGNGISQFPLPLQSNQLHLGGILTKRRYHLLMFGGILKRNINTDEYILFSFLYGLVFVHIESTCVLSYVTVFGS